MAQSLGTLEDEAKYSTSYYVTFSTWPNTSIHT